MNKYDWRDRIIVICESLIEARIIQTFFIVNMYTKLGFSEEDIDKIINENMSEFKIIEYHDCKNGNHIPSTRYAIISDTSGRYPLH